MDQADRCGEGEDSGIGGVIARVEAIHRRMGGMLPVLRVASLRLIDEAVELALAAGNDAGEVLQEVADAIHWECVKHDLQPSELQLLHPTQAEVIGEIVDVRLQAEWVARCAAVSELEVVDGARAKVAKLEAAEKDRSLEITPDGRIYRRKKP